MMQTKIPTGDSDFKESDSIACIEPRLRLPEATMTWEPDPSADEEEKLAVAAATNLCDIRAVTWAEVREHTLRNDNLPNFQKRLKTVSRALPHDWILSRVYENSSNSRMDSAQ